MGTIKIPAKKEGSLTLALDMRWINDIEDVFELANEKSATIMEQTMSIELNKPFGVAHVTFEDVFTGMEVAYALLLRKDTEKSIMGVSESLTEDVQLLDIEAMQKRGELFLDDVFGRNMLIEKPLEYESEHATGKVLYVNIYNDNAICRSFDNFDNFKRAVQYK